MSIARVTFAELDGWVTSNLLTAYLVVGLAVMVALFGAHRLIIAARGAEQPHGRAVWIESLVVAALVLPALLVLRVAGTVWIAAALLWIPVPVAVVGLVSARRVGVRRLVPAFWGAMLAAAVALGSVAVAVGAPVLLSLTQILLAWTAAGRIVVSVVQVRRVRRAGARDDG